MPAAARAGGADENTAFLYGLGSGGIEVATEKLFGGIPGLGKGKLDDVVAGLAQTERGRGALKLAIDLFGEGAEESIGTIADAYLAKLWNGDERGVWQTFWETLPDALYAALVGALSSAGLNAPNYAARVNGKQGTDFTESVKNGTLRRGSGGKDSSSSGQDIHMLLAKIDPKDETAKAIRIENFMTKYADSNVEHMLVITTDGEVHYLTSNNEKSVNTQAVADKIRDSYNLHTHPPKSTQFSFSDDVDMPNFFADGSAVMEAVDYKYHYRFERPEGITWEQWDKVRYEVKQDIRYRPDRYGLTESNYEENQQHVLISETCRRLGISKCYRRWR